MKHRKHQRIQRLHFPWQQATKSKNTAIYSVSAQCFFQKQVLFRQFLASEASQNKEGGGTLRGEIPRGCPGLSTPQAVNSVFTRPLASAKS